MKKVTRLAAVMAGLLLVTAATPAVYANCTQNAEVFPMFQCGFKAWFAPAPAGAGALASAWWQVGYGNRGVSTGVVLAATEGTGIGPPGVFSGNDSGSFAIVLTEAKNVLPVAIRPLVPVGAKCMNYEDSWGATGVDGCADNPRTTAGADNDDKLNIFYDPSYGPGIYSQYNQIDYPVGVLLTESSNQFFAVAFVSNKSRGNDQATRANNSQGGFFDLGEVTNGDANPVSAGQDDIIPWQTISRQQVDGMTFSDTNNKATSDRIVALSWTAAREVSDQSVRPSGRTLNNAGNGVGVSDQGGLIRYVVEGAPTTSATPDPNLLTWSALTTTSSNSAVVTVPPDTALRLRTVFGKNPATSAVSLANARAGMLGDLGYDVVSTLTVVAGPLVSERAIDTVALKNKNSVTVSFRTTSELTVTGIDILGKGDVVLKSINPKNGTSGGGASYDVIMTAGELKGSKELKVRLVGPDTTSAGFPIQ